MAQQTTNAPSDPEKPVWQWVFALVMTGLACAIAFKNPKRSHLG